MSHRYNHHAYIHQQHRIRISSTFLPMLCSKSSVKDVTHPRPNRRFSGEGLSPKVGCIGQLKKRNNSSSSSSSSQSDRSFSGSTPIHYHYSKLRKIFSGKNLLASNDNVKVISTAGRSRGPRVMVVGGDEISSWSCTSVDLDIDRMDPPLPVIKKDRKPEDGDSLWKRRCAMKGLQLQHIQVATN